MSNSRLRYVTADVDNAVAAALLIVHNNMHISPPTPAANLTQQRAPRLERPKITGGSSEETWNSFMTRWTMFKRGTTLTDDEKVRHLFQCCEEELGDAVLKGHPTSISGSEEELLAVIKQLAVIPVSICVRRADLLSCRQDHGESVRSYFTRIKGKAATCSYSIRCTSGTCTQVNDFTDVMVKSVLTSGLCDEEIKKDVLGWSELDDKSLDEAVNFIEAKEMARDDLASQSTSTAAVLYSYKKNNKSTPNADKVKCAENPWQGVLKLS